MDNISTTMMKASQNLIYLFLLGQPGVRPDVLYKTWEHHPVLKEYKRPEMGMLKLWFLNTVEEFEDWGIKIAYSYWTNADGNKHLGNRYFDNEHIRSN